MAEVVEQNRGDVWQAVDPLCWIDQRFRHRSTRGIASWTETRQGVAPPEDLAWTTGVDRSGEADHRPTGEPRRL